MDTTRCLQVDVDRDDVDVASGVLWQGGVSGIHELDLGGGRVRLIAGFDAAFEDRLVAALAPRWPADVFDADHDGWLDAWRPFARPVRAGRVVVHPPWEPPPWADLPVGAEDLVVAIDPGRAFGQGNHPTTRLMVAAVAERVAPGATVLDVGCGSGVLAIVAAPRRGAARVDAIDIEGEAVRATVENARRNGVDQVVHASTAPLASHRGRSDLVLANILAAVLVDLADDLVRCLAPHGSLLLSGLLAAQRDRVVAAFAERGLGPVGEHELDGWLVLEFAAPPSASHPPSPQIATDPVG